MSDEAVEKTNEVSTCNQQLAAGLCCFKTIGELRASAFFRENRAVIRELLCQPRVYRLTTVRPRLRSFLRVVAWNIERGTQLRAITHVFNNHEVLRHADVLLLNEVDDGMARSGNVNVALALAEAISAHAIYGAEYLELTKGTAQEAEASGSNTTALHGNAILTRYPFSEAEVVRLPRCENNFESAERRLGGRNGVITTLRIGNGNLTVAATHLDVVNTPRCRGRQMRALLEAIERRLAGSAAAAVLVGGDLNTHTFARGGSVRAAMNTARILAGNRERLAWKLLHPESKEPALRELCSFGYSLVEFNDREPTSRSLVASLHDADRWPGPIRSWAVNRIGSSGLWLEFRLDWLAGRGLRALDRDEMIDQATGVSSIAPQTITGLQINDRPIADHDPVVVDIRIV